MKQYLDCNLYIYHPGDCHHAECTMQLLITYNPDPIIYHTMCPNISVSKCHGNISLGHIFIQKKVADSLGQSLTNEDPLINIYLIISLLL